MIRYTPGLERDDRFLRIHIFPWFCKVFKWWSDVTCMFDVDEAVVVWRCAGVDWLVLVCI